MGYTHYWNQQRDFTAQEWTEISHAMNQLLDASPCTIRGPFGDVDELPEVTRSHIAINGNGEDGHETFMLTRNKDDGDFAVCKTARKPYDVIVTSTLIAVSRIAPDVLTISSDGTTEEWGEGLDLAAREIRISNLHIPIT